MEGNVKTRRGPLAWIRKHKKITALLLVVLLAVAAVLVIRSRASSAASTLTYQYVRTTTLQKTDLTESVSVTGTVESGSSASVTASDSVKTYKVTAVNVAVGDVVKQGDVIATLDTSDVEKQIENAQENYNDNLEEAQESYTQSVEDQTTNLTELANKVAQAQEDYDTLGITTRYASEDESRNAKTNRELVQETYESVTDEVNGLENRIANLQIQVDMGVEGAAEQMANYESQLQLLKESCIIPEIGITTSSGGQTAYDTVKSYYEKIEQYAQALEQAQQNYENGVTNNARTVDNAATKLEQAQENSDTLTDLQTTLEECTLTATMDGTITALNATVGEVCSGTVATIQDVDNLTVEVTIPTSDVSELTTGLQCNITSDATGDETILGTLTRIDPVANSQGSFTATVTVNSQDSGLLIGISAKVEIIISSKANVFTVPIDAVGTADDGSSYVLRKTGGEGVDMTFEEVTVTTGDQNDYYIEITGDDLAEGDVIRSSADLTEGIESTSESTDDLSSLLGGMGGGDMGGGDMPSGGGGGGDMPSGGGGGAPGGM